MLQPDRVMDILCLSGDPLIMLTGLLSVLLFACLPIGVFSFPHLKI